MVQSGWTELEVEPDADKPGALRITLPPKALLAAYVLLLAGLVAQWMNFRAHINAASHAGTAQVLVSTQELLTTVNSTLSEVVVNQSTLTYEVERLRDRTEKLAEAQARLAGEIRGRNPSMQAQGG